MSPALELDHLFCIVDAPGGAIENLRRDGWTLDAGSAHPGQGTRNRRLPWPRQYLELLWIVDRAEAGSSPLRLDRRADWRATGASPIGIGLRGQVPADVADDYRLYDRLGPRIYIHRDNEEAPQRPLVFILQTADEELETRTPARLAPELVARQRPDALLGATVHGPSRARLPAHAGPPIIQLEGPHHLELTVGHTDRTTAIADVLSIRG